LKSEFQKLNLNFDELTDRLRVRIRARINGGQFTERSLARILQISQPHLHNVLKGARKLNIEFADQIMRKFRMSIFDLIEDQEMWSSLEQRNPDWI
jgi:plasmid maintenance system antidote protein VapI